MLFLKRNKYFSLLSLLCLLSIALCGCAVVGPPVSQEEIQAASDELKVKAVKYQIDSLTKVNNIG